MNCFVQHTILVQQGHIDEGGVKVSYTGEIEKKFYLYCLTFNPVSIAHVIYEHRTNLDDLEWCILPPCGCGLLLTKEQRLL